MKKLFITILFASLLCPDLFAQSGWVRQSSATNLTLYDIQFFNSNTGYAAGANTDTTQGVFLKTTDGGNTWVSQSVSMGVSCIFFTDANTGFIGGRKSDFVMRTSNGGVNWVQQQIPQGFVIPSTANDIYFRNSNTGFIATINAMYSTTNSGTNWSVASSLNQPYFEYFYFSNPNTGFLMGAECIKTTNGGANWNQISYASFSYEMSGYDDNNLMIVATGTAYFISTSGGMDWGEDPLFIKGAWKDTSFNSCKFFGPHNAIIIGGGGKIYKTTSSIVSWTIQPSGVGSTLYRLNFINSNTGWIAGANGVILKTTTGGTVGFTQISTELPEKYLLKQNHPNPFNPATKISFSIPEFSFVNLTVHDVNGREAASLLNEKMNAGNYEVNFDAAHLPGGIYFYKLQTEEFSETKKMILIK